MGSVRAQTVLGIAEPKIGLMNVGEKEGKGHELVGGYPKHFCLVFKRR